MSQKSFLIRLLGISFFVEILAVGWFYAMPPEWVTPTLPVLPVFFMAITFLIHKGFLSSIGKNMRQFVTRYMLITTIKLLSFLTILLIYGLLKPNDAIQFMLSFMVLYIIYSAFEATAVIKLGKANDEASKN